MALISRPIKTGLTYTYVDEVLAGETTIKATEVDADLDAILAQVNGNIDVNNLANDAVETAKIKDAQITTAKLATGSVKTATISDLNVISSKLAPNAVTAGKLADGVVITDLVTGTVATNLDVTTVETTLATIPGLVIAASNVAVLVPSFFAIAHFLGGSSATITVRLKRDALLICEWVLWQPLTPIMFYTGSLMIPLSIYINLPVPGTYTYTYTVQSNDADTHILTHPTLVGHIWGLALRG